MSAILAAGAWNTNAELIADCAALGYLPGSVLDATYGRGGFWTVWRPRHLVCHDLYTLDGVDFRHLPERDETYGAVVLDPPYKLNGTPAMGDMDNRYGVDVPSSWQGRMQSIRDGITECVRVVNTGGYLLLKCQDQVVSGKVRWQTDDFSAHAIAAGCEKVDSFNFPGYRPQPDGRSQQHARRNFSTLLVFRKLARFP